MSQTSDNSKLNRRRFIQTTAAGVGAAAIAGSITRAADERPPATAPAGKIDEKALIWRSRSPEM